ncbi:MAG: thiamine pyrophosphate-dependent enzyme, partial [Myxococcota bacterium]|nr:thiamine pyrophosphate-dependent enzyme [Myxococcota bacterium]
EAEQKMAGIHHQVKDVDTQYRIMAEVTCAARVLHHPELAAREVHEVVRRVMQEHRPGYLEIHRDMVDVTVDVPKALRDFDGRFPKAGSDARKLDEAVADAVRRLREAKRPVLIGGVELFRERAERAFLELAEKLRAPVATSVLAKGVFPMDHPLHMGIHVGPFSAKPIQERVRKADLVLALGTQLTDMNLGASRPQVSRDRSVWAVERRVNVSFHSYTDVALGDFVAALARHRLPRFKEKVRYHDNLKRPGPDDGRLGVNELLVEVNRFLEESPGYDVFAESGDMLFGGLELRCHGGLYFAQGYYASMGFGLPAALGAQIGTAVRPLVLTGDGAFQMTGSEIAHAPRHGLSPVVIVVDNGGWGIFRPVSPRRDLLEIPGWPYAELARSWGGVGFVAETPRELREALRAAHALRDFVVIQARVPPDDLSPITRRYIRASARRAAPGRGRDASGR